MRANLNPGRGRRFGFSLPSEVPRAATGPGSGCRLLSSTLAHVQRPKQMTIPNASSCISVSFASCIVLSSIDDRGGGLYLPLSQNLKRAREGFSSPGPIVICFGARCRSPPFKLEWGLGTVMVAALQAAFVDVLVAWPGS